MIRDAIQRYLWANASPLCWHNRVTKVPWSTYTPLNRQLSWCISVLWHPGTNSGTGKQVNCADRQRGWRHQWLWLVHSLFSLVVCRRVITPEMLPLRPPDVLKAVAGPFSMLDDGLWGSLGRCLETPKAAPMGGSLSIFLGGLERRAPLGLQVVCEG